MSLSARIRQLLEVSDARLNLLSKQFGLTKAQVIAVAEADPSGGKYLTWLLRQQKADNLRFPEDVGKCRERLSQFAELSVKPGWNGPRDINQFEAYGDLAKAVNDNLGVKTKGELLRAAEVNGAELLRQDGDLSLYKVTTPEAAAKLFRHTEWCVKDPKFFKHYRAPFYYLEKGGRPFKLLHLRKMQCMDVYDKPTTIDEFEQLGVDLTELKNDPEWAYTYAKDVIRGRRPEIERVISGHAMWVCKYAKGVIKGRWPEEEGTIKTDVRWAYQYAKDVIKGRWPEGEEVISKDAEWAYQYAVDTIKGRWPEGEEAISKDAYYAHCYARSIIEGRWLKGEEAISKDAQWAYVYSLNVVKGRWPEGEETLKKSPTWAYDYARYILGSRWPEAEETIKKDPEAAYRYRKWLGIRL